MPSLYTWEIYLSRKDAKFYTQVAKIS